MTKFITIIIFIIIIIFIVPLSLATDSTPSADIKSKLEELQKEIASKAAKLKQEVNKKLKDKAYAGAVKTKSQSSLTLTSKKGPKIVSLNQDTLLPKKKIAEKDYIAALGDIDETGVLIARKVILLPTPNSQPKTFLWGQIAAISDKLVTLKDKGLKSQAVSIADSSEIRVGNFVILTGSFGKNDIFKADFVYVIPQGGFIKPKKVFHPAPTGAGATPSAKNSQPRIYLSPHPQPSKTPRP